jgi:hypothetical protein
MVGWNAVEIGLRSTGISSVEPWSSASNDSSDPRCNQSEVGYRILSSIILRRTFHGCTHSIMELSPS